MDYYSKIVQSVYGNLEKKARDRIILHILLYLFKIENVTKINNRIRKILSLEKHANDRSNIVKLRKKLVTSGYVFNLKAFLFAVVAFENRVPIKKIAKKYQIKPEDICLTRFLNNKKFKSILLEYTYSYRVLSLEDFKKETQDMISTIDIWIRKFIMRKKKFIMRSFNLDLEDLVNDLLLLGIRGLIMQYPCFDSKLHMLNYLKKTIHNCGINIIKFFTRNKRNLTGNVKVSYDALIDGVFLYNKEKGTQTVSDLIGSMSTSSTIGNLENSLDLEISVSQLIQNTKSEKRKKMIQLMMGTLDKDFSKWLYKKRICSDDIDNVEFQIRCLEKNKLIKYKRYVFQYLGFSEEKGERILKNFGAQLV